MNYPEHEKLKAVAHLSQSNGEFLDWLQSEKRIVLARYVDDSDELQPVCVPITRLLAEFHEIDEKKVEAEKRAMLDAMRKKP